MVEVHVTLSREMFGPDVAASVTTGELRLLADGARYISAALAAPVDKDEGATELAPMRALFGRSLVARCPLAAGHILTASDRQETSRWHPPPSWSPSSAAAYAARWPQTTPCTTPTSIPPGQGGP